MRSLNRYVSQLLGHANNFICREGYTFQYIDRRQLSTVFSAYNISICQFWRHLSRSSYRHVRTASFQEQPGPGTDKNAKEENETNSEHRLHHKVGRFAEKDKFFPMKKFHNRDLDEINEINRKFKIEEHLKEEDSFGILSGDVQKLDSTKAMKLGYGESTLNKSEMDPSHGRQGSKSERKWRNTFGSLSEGDMTQLQKESQHDKDDRFLDDSDEEYRRRRPLSQTGKYHTPHWYGRQIEKLGKEGKIKEAIDVLEEWMLKRDRVRPNPYVFTALIGVVGRVGYTKKAFHLFNQMKKMGLQPEEPTYTALINACANSPWKEDGLSRANKLRDLMQEKGYEPNLINYKAMIKAYGVLGNLEMAFFLMEELARRYTPDAESFSFLLMACIADRQAGFVHGVQVWKLMRRYRVKPDLPLYNLLLRVVRDCGVGKHAEDLLESDIQELKKLESGDSAKTELDTVHVVTKGNFKTSDKCLEDDLDRIHEPATVTYPGNSDSDEHFHSAGDKLEWWQYEETKPAGIVELDLLPSRTESMGKMLPLDSATSEAFTRVVSLDSLTKPENRLALIGGFRGFLRNMEEDAVAPNVITFSQLFEVCPPTVDAESELLSIMKLKGVKPDIDLFNAVIHRRCLRNDLQSARDVLHLISAHSLNVNVRTFGCLAMTCKRKTDGLQLLKNMLGTGLMPNTEIMGTLMYASQMDFHYKLELLKQMEAFDLQPNDKFLLHTERSVAFAKKRIVQAEKGYHVGDFYQSEYFQSGFREFMFFYRPWLERTKYTKPPHPWKDFRHSQETPNC